MAIGPDEHGDRPEGAAARALARAVSAPVRAVTRILNPGDEPAAAAGPPQGSGIVDCALYVDGERRPGPLDYRAALAAARAEPGAFVWLGLHEPGDAEMAGIATAYGLHELAVEDAVKAAQRPKLEQFGKVSFLVLRTARYVEHAELTDTSEVVETGQVMLFIGPQFVISVRHGDACRLAPVRADLETKRELLREGAWAVAYAVTDRVVDLYLDVAMRLEQDLDTIEEFVFSREPDSGEGAVQQIYQLKRELVEFRRAAAPLQRPLQTLIGDTGAGVPETVRRYFRDVQDHLTRTVEQVNAYDELLNSILQVRLAQVSVAQNNDMRKIAAWAAIAAVQTGIAGVYGMNFRVMPGTQWQFGYPAVLLLMFLLALVLYRLFRRSGWL
ncbi:MAG TPA: magnesium and cobalt transport protein CorA [Pilimelia sp.]|nr:magnesium and cobalt transport protein CorA [Pilimelia sp.]